MIKDKKGFTLIELIIVMAIVGILAVVAVVAIASKAGSARDARRRSDLSAIQTAYALHTANGNGNGDVAADPTSGNGFPVINVGNDPGVYMDMSNINDPGRTGACRDNDLLGLVQPTCDPTIPEENLSVNANYTFLELAGGVDADVGTFANYNIGVTLEDTNDFLYLTQLGITFDDN